MPATVAGAQTTAADVSPTHTAAGLNTIWGTAPENLTVKQLHYLTHALACRAEGEAPTTVIGTLFP